MNSKLIKLFYIPLVCLIAIFSVRFLTYASGPSDSFQLCYFNGKITNISENSDDVSFEVAEGALINISNNFKNLNFLELTYLGFTYERRSPSYVEFQMLNRCPSTTEFESVTIFIDKNLKAVGLELEKSFGLKVVKVLNEEK